MNHDSRVTSEASPDRRIDKICDAYESVWSKGERPHINGFLEQCDEAYRAELFYELLLVELEFRRLQGERPTLAEYLRDFPQFAEQIEAADFHSGGLAFATKTGAVDAALAIRNHQPGSRIDHFELVERLGAGAMGEVWKAQDTRLRRFVAIKLPRAETLTEADLRRFLREGQAAAQLRHPRLAAVHQVGREGKTVFIVADYVEGDNLRAYLAAHSLNHAEMAELCAEVAEALHHAHELEIVHRDLKPANIIVDRAGKPHVIDFGLAKWSNDDRDLTLQGELLGTPAYMSPEQANGDSANLDRRTDVYSLGVILYEMLTGRCPFVGDRGSVIHQILVREPEPPRTRERQIPRDLDTICVKALEKDPNRRYATLQEMAVDLRRFARGEPILTRRMGLLEKSWRWARRHPAFAAAAVLLVAVIVVAATASVMINSLREKNYRLQGFRSVLVWTPSGASVAIVPIDNRSGEPDPNPDGIIRLMTSDTSRVHLKPGEYFVEAVLPGKGEVIDLAEEYLTVPDQGWLSESERKWNRDHGYEEDQVNFNLEIRNGKEVIADMVAIPIAESLRRENPLLPKLLYVDAIETKPGNPQTGLQADADGLDQRNLITFDKAISKLHNQGKRLPSEAEYDAIVRAIKDPDVGFNASGNWAGLDDLFDDLKEWTTTKYRFLAGGRSVGVAKLESMRVLKGSSDFEKIAGLRLTPDGKLVAPPDALSPIIGYRGVRSGTPRFITP